MPVYEYACQACGHEFEEWQKMSDPPVKVCPKCKAKKVERLISRTSFQLKGGGWYGDLYASTKPGSGNKDTEGNGKAEKTQGNGKTEGNGKAEAGKAEGKTANEKSETKSSGKSETKVDAKSTPSTPSKKKGKNEAA